MEKWDNNFKKFEFVEFLFVAGLFTWFSVKVR